MIDEQEKELSPEEHVKKALKEAAEVREKQMEIISNWGVTYKFPDPFLQRDSTKYQTRLKKLGNKIDTAVAVYKGLIVRAALELEWLSGEKVEDISTMTPGEVTLLSNLIWLDILEASQVPNE